MTNETKPKQVRKETVMAVKGFFPDVDEVDADDLTPEGKVLRGQVVKMAKPSVTYYVKHKIVTRDVPKDEDEEA